MLNTLDTDIDRDEVPDWLIPVLNHQYAAVSSDLPDVTETTFDYRVAVIQPLRYSGQHPTAEQAALRDELGYPLQLNKDASAVDRTGTVAIVRETNGGFLANLDPEVNRNVPHTTSILPFFQSDDQEQLIEVAQMVQEAHDYIFEATDNELSANQGMVCAAADLGKRMGFVDPQTPQFIEAYGRMVDPTIDPFEICSFREVLAKVHPDIESVAVVIEDEAAAPVDMSWLDTIDLDM